MSATFTERRIDIETSSVRCFEAGQGETVVALHGDSDAVPTQLETLLSEKFRVVALRIPDPAIRAPKSASRVIDGAARHLGLKNYSLIVSPAATAPGLHHVLDSTTQVEALVLISPTGNIDDLEARLGDIKATTLVLAGTKDKSVSSAGRRCADHIHDSYFMVVYDAGPAMENERPAALFETIADFIERRGKFVLERHDSALSP